MGRASLIAILAAVFTLLLSNGQPVSAQPNFDDLFKTDLGNSLSSPAKSDADATVAATLTRDAAVPGEALLEITVTLPEGARTYGQDSTAQKKAEIKINAVPGLTALGEGFTPDRAPTVEFEPVFNKKVGKYTDSVTFSRRFQIDPAAEHPQLDGTISLLICTDQACVVVDKPFAANLAGGDAVDAAPTPPPGSEQAAPLADAPPFAAGPVSTDPRQFGYRFVPTRKSKGQLVDDPVRVQFELQPSDAKSGDLVTLAITMELDAGWATYSLTPGQDQIELPTEISLDQLEGLTAEGEWTETPQATVKVTEGKHSRYHAERVTWKQTFRRTDAPQMGVSGSFFYQICEIGKSCQPPKNVPFELGPTQDAGLIASASPVTQSFVSTPDLPLNVEVVGGGNSRSFAGWMAMAFFGGLLLNIMPCVLPVLAIKILSFVQQAGESRSRVIALNVAYTGGVLAVFWILATLAVFASFGAGGIFQLPWFRVATVLLLYVVGLNLLGVFEFHLPGAISQAAGGGHREGLPGAFMTGVFTTLLATPCTIGPIASVIAWSLTQTLPVIYLVWAMLALGMASPYLVIGIFPQLVRYLPRPGMWMVRFKQASAFAMFAAAIFFLRGIDQRDLVALLTAVLGISLALWMIGQLYDQMTPLRIKNIVRVSALAVAAATCVLGWSMHREATMTLAHHLPWEPFSSERFVELRNQGKPMLVDFTADWCVICKVNESVALNTLETAEFVKDRNVVTLMADWTDQNEEIKGWLDRFGSNGVPLTVIVPPDPKEKLVLLSGPYTKGQLLEKLDAVIPAKPATKVAVQLNATQMAGD